jgi:hypothetical protein
LQTDETTSPHVVSIDSLKDKFSYTRLRSVLYSDYEPGKMKDSSPCDRLNFSGWRLQPRMNLAGYQAGYVVGGSELTQVCHLPAQISVEAENAVCA